MRIYIVCKYCLLRAGLRKIYQVYQFYFNNTPSDYSLVVMDIGIENLGFLSEKTYGGHILEVFRSTTAPTNKPIHPSWFLLYHPYQPRQCL